MAVNMKTPSSAFNLNLLFLLLLLFCGCSSADKKKKDKDAATLRFHLEVNPADTTRAVSANISRDPPIQIYVDRDAILNEGDIEVAGLAPALGGYAIKIQFNRHGTWILENVTTGYKGKRLAVFSQFGKGNDRWLGAPLIRERISTGLFVFSPDATYEEAEKIVKGLNNVAAEIRKKDSQF